MENSIYQLFVYGSLRSQFKHAAYAYISKYFNLVGEGRVRGKLYDLGSYPGAIPATDESFIIGELYQIKNSEDFYRAMELLDEYEGVNPSEGEPPIFKREPATIFLKEANQTTAWVYWYAGFIEDQPLITSGDIVDFLEHKRKL